ncbi:MAG: glycogen synthase GlgA [Thiobacillaceae bacterium]|nr:glycogen synthase GlgA [Thiobacillaceae bacterium]
MPRPRVRATRHAPAMKVLFATPEARPLVKTGGLADVSAALPAALCAIGLDCRLLLPGYSAVLAGALDLQERAWLYDLPGFGAVRLLQGRMPDSGVPLYVIDYPYHYQREGGPYQDAHGRDYPDNAWRFALLSRIAALLSSPASPLDWRPDLLHCNDWQTGLAPAYLHFAGRPVPALMTVHNLAYQGIFPPDLVTALGLPAESFSIDGVEYYGNFSFLKAGLYYADWISTVSPSYAEEIQRAPLGMGLEGLLAGRRERLTGILNGIDTADWNPSSDLHLPCSYSARALTGKRRCKLALQQDLNLDPLPQAPLAGVISRLTYQKGIDWILAVADRWVAAGGQLVILGKGEAHLEADCQAVAARHPGRIAAIVGYDEGLSHRVEAGADLFLMPSRFEPCGLNQMYSQRYGTVPVVHAVGGLKDTVEDGVTGFVFLEPSAEGLWQAMERALALWGDPDSWRRMMLAGMHKDFSWEASAQRYAWLYRMLVLTSGR